MVFVQPVTLTGDLVELRPLEPADHDGLVEAARDGELWTLSYTAVPRPEEMRGAIDGWLAQQAAGDMLPFTVRRRDSGRVIGMSTFCNVTGRTGTSRSGQRGTPARRTGAGPTPRASCCC